MDEYIKRSDLLEDIENTIVFSGKVGHLNPKQIGARMVIQRIKAAPAADVVPVADLKEFAADVVYQFGYKIHYKGRLHLTAGGLSTLEKAFDILGWEDPKPYPEGECEMDGCHEYATCGINTPDGYKRVCAKHLGELITEIYSPAEGR